MYLLFGVTVKKIWRPWLGLPLSCARLPIPNPSLRLSVLFLKPESNHLTTLLKSLHWLPVISWVKSTLLSIAYKLLYNLNPDHLGYHSPCPAFPVSTSYSSHVVPLAFVQICLPLYPSTSLFLLLGIQSPTCHLIFKDRNQKSLVLRNPSQIPASLSCLCAFLSESLPQPDLARAGEAQGCVSCDSVAQAQPRSWVCSAKLTSLIELTHHHTSGLWGFFFFNLPIYLNAF